METIEIYGEVKDGNGAPVENANITLMIGNEVLNIAISDSVGKFDHKVVKDPHFLGSELTYIVKKEGYRPETKKIKIEGTKVSLGDIKLIEDISSTPIAPQKQVDKKPDDKKPMNLILAGLAAAAILIIAVWLYWPAVPPAPIAESITFEAFPDGTPITNDIILKGDEFSAKGVLLAGAPESSYCEDASAVAIHRPASMYNVDFNYLSSSDPQNINRCSGVPVAITFIEPVREVTLTFAGASVTYTMHAYDNSNRLLGTVTKDAVIRGGTFMITYSTEQPEIKRVTFGKEAAGNMIEEIYYER